ncbi:MAG: hypothetical protein FWH18_12785 [Marinilabiliaceae bacterium]|nr:hypothetical protein [Marinilabiliaceae bacterium]
MDNQTENIIEQEKITALAKNTKHYIDLLVEQCDGWLPEKEGLKNMRDNYRTRIKKRKT